eukprot:GHVP01025404.1.p1 GENE.GHVP01025404.1~~GHVP01025404.1.p1  ORF type:complete len:104 (+),score=17.97 GHVP01025404.1:1540-1851(+)
MDNISKKKENILKLEPGDLVIISAEVIDGCIVMIVSHVPINEEKGENISNRERKEFSWKFKLSHTAFIQSNKFHRLGMVEMCSWIELCSGGDSIAIASLASAL